MFWSPSLDLLLNRTPPENKCQRFLENLPIIELGLDKSTKNEYNFLVRL